MNLRCYRLVFNRTRGLWMAVAETVRSHRAAGSGARRRCSRPLLALLALLASGPLMASAQIVPDPSAPAARQPIVTVAPNNVPLVNIQTPNGAGVSRNDYRQFDVQREGVILNNATHSVQTQLGGWVPANPLLLRPATVIVNEVHSSDPSLLRGHVEVAGARAQVIIANPSGISCDGCGFINAYRATLTTGQPHYGVTGHLDHYLVRRGTINIVGDGLDTRNTDFTDVIARAVRVNAAIHARDLAVIAGSNDVDAATRHTRAVTAEGAPPEVAIDVGTLGGMYARKIWLIGTEAGVGVRSAGTLGGTTLGGAETIRLTSAGRLEISGLVSSDRLLELQADQGLTHRGTLYAGEQVSLQVAGDLDNRGGLIASGSTLSIQDAAPATKSLAISNTGGTLIGDTVAIDAASLSGDGRVLGSTDVTVRLTSDYTHTGELAANRHLHLSTTGTVTNHATLSAGQSLTMNAGQLHNDADGSLIAPTMVLQATDSTGLTNRGLIDGTDVRLVSPTINNLGSGRLYGDRLALAADSVLNEAEGGNAPVIAARTQLDIGTDQLSNRQGALIYSDGDLAIGRRLNEQGQATGSARRVDNHGGTVEAQGHLTIAADELSNTNAHFSTRIETRPVENIVELAGAGSPTRYRPDAPDVYIYNRESDHLHTPERNYERWARYTYQRSITDEVTATSAPGQLLAGGDVRLRGQTFSNDKSRVLAGGALDVQVATLNNLDATGTRIIRDRGIVTSFWRDHQDGRDRTGRRNAPYEPAPVVQTLSLGVLDYRDRVTPASGGFGGNGGNGSPNPSGGNGSAVRTVDLAATMPAGSLYRPAPPVRDYLVETDTRFTNRRQWLDSGYLLRQMPLDPQQMHKRLGDGFYEQKLVREQLAQLTGRRFLPGQSNDEAQFRALMDNGITFAQAHQLRPGVALSAEQMATLTSDLVWLVERDITLPGGQVTRALVPQVYLRVREGDLTPEGTLLGGERVQLMLTGDLNNSGTIAGGQAVNLNAATVKNRGGTIAGERLTVHARQDIDGTGGQFRADQALVLTAGNDITVASTTRHQSTAQGSRTNVDQVGTLAVKHDDGQMVVIAGRDLTLQGAVVRQGPSADASANATSNVTSNVTSNATNTTANSTPATTALPGRIVLAAGNDVRLDTVTESRSERIDWRRGNHRSESSRTDVATTITGSGTVDIAAGRDLTARGAQVTTRDGAITASAERDVVLTTAQSHASVDEAHRHTRSGAVSKTTYSYRDSLEQTTQQGTLLSGQQVHVRAGQDAQLHGSQVVSSDGTTITATRNVTIDAATDTHHETHVSQRKSSGLMGSGGIGVTLGTRSLKTTGDTIATTASGSTVGSTQGNVTIQAGQTVHQSGSAVLAPQGDVTIAGRQVEIVEARNSETHVTGVQFRQTGVTVAVSTPVLSALQTAQQMSEAASNTRDGRMQALAAANTALAAASAVQAVKAGQGSTINGKADQISTGTDAAGNPTSRDANAGDKIGGIQVAVSLGTSKSHSQVVVTREDVVGSTVAAAGDVTIHASGQTWASDLPPAMPTQAVPVQAVPVQAGPTQANSQPSNSASSTFESPNAGNVLVQGSQITAGHQATLIADQTLTLQAAANTQTQQSNQGNHSASVGVVMDTRGTVGVTLAGSRGRGQADGQDVRWTNTQISAGQQATLLSGTDTTLSGAVVSAPQVTVVTDRQLTIDSRQDTSRYESHQQQSGGSVTLGAAPSANLNHAQSSIDSHYASVIEQSGIRAGDGGFQVKVAGDTQLSGGAITSTSAAVEAQRNAFNTGGTLTTTDIENRAHYQAQSTSVNVGTGFSPAGALAPAGTGVGFGHDSGQASSVTKSGISGVAGDTALRTGDKETGIAKIFDAERVQKDVTAQTQITQTFTMLAPKQVAAYAEGKVRELKEQLGQEIDPQRQAELQAEWQRWEEGGTYRVLMHTATGGLVGGVSGAAGAGVAAIAAPTLNEAQVNLEGELVKAGMSPALAKGVAANVSGLAAAGLGTAVGGATGAGVGLAVDANNRQLHPDEAKWIKDNAKRFAKQQGISEQEAETRLGQQAFRQVQFGASGIEDAAARNFLGQTKGMLAADPACPDCGPGYLFFATPTQKANTGMYATKVLSDPDALDFYGKNSRGQPSAQQTQDGARRDAEIRSTIANATIGAASAAASLTVPPALSWCLTNPVACNRIVIAGGEIAAGEALGPAGLGVVGTLSTVKAVRTADEVNAAMKARGWEPAWSPGTPVIEMTLQPGTKVNMIVDAKTAQAIAENRIEKIAPGGWATFDDVTSVSLDVRQRAAITTQFKNNVDGPFYLVEMEVSQPLHSNIGFVGAQREFAGANLRGGGTQIQFDQSIAGKDRWHFLKPISSPKILN